MTLREQVTADLSAFLNVDEFGESVDIDGSTVTCVFDPVVDTPASQEGVFNQDRTISVRAADFAERPVVTQRLTIAGEQATVVAVDEQQGMLVIRLRWPNS